MEAPAVKEEHAPPIRQSEQSGEKEKVQEAAEDTSSGAGALSEKKDDVPASDSTPASAPFTPRSILRRRESGAEASVTEGSGANTPRSSSTTKKAKISNDVSFMPDVFYEPPLATLFVGGSSGSGRFSSSGGSREGGEEGHESGEGAIPSHERLYKIAQTREEELEAKRLAIRQAEEARLAKQCTFDPKTTRKKGKGGAERAKEPPYASFNEFIQLQERWLKNAPKRIEKLVQQHKDIEAGKRDPRSEMGKTTKLLVSKMEKEKRYEHPVANWDKRFNDFVLRKSSDILIDELMAGGPQGGGELLTSHGNSSSSFMNEREGGGGGLSAHDTTPATNSSSLLNASLGASTLARKRLKALESQVHPFSPVISAYAEAKAVRERANSNGKGHSKTTTRGSLSPIRQSWEQDPAAYAMRTDVPFRAKRASDSVFEKLYNESVVRAAATRVLKESYIENEMSTLFKPKTNESSAQMAAWQFSASRSRSGTSLRGGAAQSRSLVIVSQSEEEDFVEFADGSYCFNGQHYADDGSHIGPAPDLSECGKLGDDGVGTIEGEAMTPSLGFLSDLSGIPRNPDEVVDSLLQKGEEYKERRERKRQQIEASQREFPFKPMTNKNSHKILADFAKRAEEELTNELARRAMDEMNAGVADATSDALPEGVKGIPQPKKAAKFSVAEFTRRIERAAALKNAKLQALIEQRDAEELGECSFRPALAVNSLRGYSPAGARRPHNIYTPGSVASTYSASDPTSVARISASAIRCRTPNSNNVSRSSMNASPLDTRHRFVSKREHANGPIVNAAGRTPSSSSLAASLSMRSVGAKSGAKPKTIVNDNYPLRQPQYSSERNHQRDTVADVSRMPSTAPRLSPSSEAANVDVERSYEIPLADAPITAQRVDPMHMLDRQRSSSGGPALSTDSRYHDHHDEEDELISGAGGAGGRPVGGAARYEDAAGFEDDSYLDAIENEMRDVLADWRSAARGRVGTIREY